MGQAGRFLRRTGARDGHTAGGYSHWCPACEEMHQFATDGRNSSGAQWVFNGNPERPSFTPSMHIRINPPDHPHYQRDVASSVCHYFLRDGVIEYLSDCTHALRGQKVPLPELPPHLRDPQ